MVPRSYELPGPWPNLGKRSDMAKPICSVVGCGRPSNARTWCNAHYGRWKTRGTPGTDPNLWAYADPIETIHARTLIDPDTGCWLWQGHVHQPSGYGQINRRGHVYAHRFAYAFLVGPIPPGLELDHLCRVRRCVNPAHLEPVTSKENNRRGRPYRTAKTHCVNGHPFDAANTALDSRGWRRCRACDRATNARMRANATAHRIDERVP